MNTPTPGSGQPSLSTAERAAPASPASPASPAAPTASRGFRGFAARRPIVAMLVMIFSIAYPLMFLVVLAQHEVIPGKDLIDRMPIPVDEQAAVLLTFFGLLPPAIYVTWAAEGRTGLRNLFRRVTRWRFGVGWWVFILTALPILTIASGLLLGDRLVTTDPVAFLASQVPQLLIQIFVINLWEETAWAGVMQTRLERRHNVFVAALVTAVPFGFAHWPLAFLGDISAIGVPLSVLAYILLGVLVRPLAGLTMRGARDSVLAFALVHSMFNRTNNQGGISDTVLDGAMFQVGLLVVLLVLTAVVAVVMRRRLGPSYRRQLEQGRAVPTRSGER